MKKTAFCTFVILFLISCKQSDFMQQVQGTWKVTEVNYLYELHTQSYYPVDQKFIFENYSYQHWMDGTMKESGTFNVNFKATQIQFFSDLGNSTYVIIEKTDNHQHWKSKNKIIDFYLDFKLEKLP